MLIDAIRKIEKEAHTLKSQFDTIPFCTLENVSDQYLATLANSQVAVIYGGYNSLTDIMAAKVPSVVIIRGMSDREQEEHVHKIHQLKPNLIFAMKESDVNPKTLAQGLERQLKAKIDDEGEIMLNGAEFTAERLIECL